MFLTATEFLDRYDARLSRQRLLDRGQDADLEDLTDESTDAGRRLRTAIDDAEGLLVSAAAVGTRYRVKDLLDVVNAGVSASASTIKRVVADLALGIVLKRRSLPAEEFKQLAPGYDEAVAFLQLIRSGERVFPDIPGVPEAGLPSIGSNVPGQSLVPPPLLWTQTGGRLFGNLFPGDC